MSKDEDKRKLTGAWQSIHAVVWLIGLAILAWQGWWWPGILVLVAISVIFEAVLKQYVPQAVEKVETTQAPAQPIPQTNAALVTITPPEHRVDLLPAACSKCGGPLRGHEVRWTGPQSADCPFCGANIPMGKG
jgi:hypothetical protein